MTPARHRSSAAAVAAACLLGALVCMALGGTPACADRASQLSRALAAKRAQEQSLRAGIAADNAAINRYQGSISSLESRLARVQAAQAAEQAKLFQLQNRERVEQARLTKLELQLQQADAALARNLVGSYEQDQPDALGVILSARGFADLLERIDFLKRIKNENVSVISDDRLARVRVIAEANRLGALEAQAQKVATAMQAQSNQVNGLRIALVSRQLIYVRARASKRGALSFTAAESHSLQARLSRLQAAAAAPTGSGGGGSSGPVMRGGGFTFPLPGGSAGGPGSWSQDQGVDISAPGNTPELAVGSGTIVLHGIGGFGPWAPVLHLDSPIDGQSYVYYGHAGPQGELPIGSHVSAGAVIGSIGPGIVGISTGPHLEIGFADASGSPAPGTSGTMLSLLQRSYHG